MSLGMIRDARHLEQALIEAFGTLRDVSVDEPESPLVWGAVEIQTLEAADVTSDHPGSRGLVLSFEDGSEYRLLIVPVLGANREEE